MDTGRNIVTLYVTNRKEWREWLEKNHSAEREVWLIYYKKHTCKARIPYDDAVEEAICYGWIDSIIRRIDENSYCQRFTPRRSGSRWSVPNMDRARRMLEEGKMTEKGTRLYMEAIENPSLVIPERRNDIDLPLPAGLEERLRKEGAAYDNFISFSRSYRNMCIDWITTAKREETRQRRIDEVAIKASKGEKIGLK